MAHALVIGPGAIGTFVAAHMIAAGHEVTVACRTRQTAEDIAEDGLRAKPRRGRALHVPAHAVSVPEDVDADVVVLATKCAAACDAWESWQPHVPDDAPLLALQNGIMGDALEARAGDRLVMGTVAFPARLEDVGWSEQLAGGGYHIGPWPRGPADDAVMRCVEILKPSGVVHVSDRMEGIQWTKLLVNSAMTGLGILTEERIGRVLGDARGRQAVRGLITEGYEVGLAAGITFEPLQGFHPRMMASGHSRIPVAVQNALIHAYGRKYGNHSSSSMPDLERGRPTEVKFLNGHIAQVGATHGVPTPLHDAIVERVAAIERRALDGDMDQLEELLSVHSPHQRL